MKNVLLPLIANVFSDILAKPELCANKIHPNAQGYQQMASDIHAGLKSFELAR
jgi:acyl-CoA thioesterase-1